MQIGMQIKCVVIIHHKEIYFNTIHVTFEIKEENKFAYEKDVCAYLFLQEELILTKYVILQGTQHLPRFSEFIDILIL